MKIFSPFFYLDSVTLIFSQLYASTTGRVINNQLFYIRIGYIYIRKPLSHNVYIYKADDFLLDINDSIILTRSHFIVINRHKNLLNLL